MDFGLHIGPKETQNEVRSSSLNFGEQDSAKFKVDLGLSLSIGPAESDVTSITLASSSVQARSDIQVASRMVQLVDEGSTSSKWRGPLLHPLMNPFPNVVDTPLVSDSYPPIKDPFSCHLGLPLSNTGQIENPVPVPNPGSKNEQHKVNVKTCQFPGCSKGARGASGRCISHGGGRRCKKEGCLKGAEGKTVFCKAHGGGRRCEHLGCTRSAEGLTDFCITHGGGRRCSHHEGCQRASRGKSGLCIRHGGGKRCKVENCTKSAEGLSGCCIAHGGGRRCQYSDCPKGAQGSTTYCKAHGGGKRCTYPGCNKGAEGSTLLCKGHGGGKRCQFEEGCTKSVHGGTLFCVAHGGGKRCAVPDCPRSARGKTNCCVRHGGGKRCQHEGCGKSAQGSTDFCKAHGGGRRCLWGQPGSQFGADAIAPCDKFARGKIGLCAAHNAYVQDKCVHGESTVIHILQDSEPTISIREGIIEGLSCKIPRFAANARRCYGVAAAAIGELIKKMEKRNRRPARYPAGIDQIIQQVDILKCASFIAVLEFGLIETNRPLGKWFYLILSLLVSQLAILTLKEKLPEVAAVAVVAGVSTVSLLVLMIGYEFGGVPSGPLFAASFILVAMVMVWVYTIIKEDVRAPEEEVGESTVPLV